MSPQLPSLTEFPPRLCLSRFSKAESRLYWWWILAGWCLVLFLKEDPESSHCTVTPIRSIRSTTRNERRKYTQLVFVWYFMGQTQNFAGEEMTKPTHPQRSSYYRFFFKWTTACFVQSQVHDFWGIIPNKRILGEKDMDTTMRWKPDPFSGWFTILVWSLINR